MSVVRCAVAGVDGIAPQLKTESELSTNTQITVSDEQLKEAFINPKDTQAALAMIRQFRAEVLCRKKIDFTINNGSDTFYK
ncbi:hypothetical protein D5018_12180 [Parashewanella curva]|uniref:Uncharacterized protein n=1 Tax=Parashewanella curva TaxID=2338552 RepID=A0A3L8PXC0_9GAMM|nr:hypothetical protein [Parashewanella curva]RLV59449.1 hypothetical protein D5018_12180 [Parashewanella curva]